MTDNWKNIYDMFGVLQNNIKVIINKFIFSIDVWQRFSEINNQVISQL